MQNEFESTKKFVLELQNQYVKIIMSIFQLNSFHFRRATRKRRSLFLTITF